MNALDDCFAFDGRRIRHDDAMTLLRALPLAEPAVEAINIFEAGGRIAAETLRAPRPIPAHTNAAVDGYAFAFDGYDPARGGRFEISSRIAAGDLLNAPVPCGCAARILTGAVMPEGCDTVAMQEDCAVSEQEGRKIVEIPGGLKAGGNRRLAGEDVAQGAEIVAAGQRLRPQEIATLAASGFRSIRCYRRPRVCVFSTGNEVLPPGGAFEDGKVFDANGPMLAALFKPLGACVTYGGILPDKQEAVHDALEAASADHDMIITSGGASLGEEDHVVAVLRAAKGLSLWQLAIKPGRPLGVGQMGDTLCFALPGNPVAVFVCALIYVLPVLHRLQGEPWREPVRMSVPADFEMKSRKKGRREFFRGMLGGEPGRLSVRKFPRDGSGLITSLRESNGLIEIEEDRETIFSGDPVAFIPYSAFGIL